jgi:hypothetical protein
MQLAGRATGRRPAEEQRELLGDNSDPCISVRHHHPNQCNANALLWSSGLLAGIGVILSCMSAVCIGHWPCFSSHPCRCHAKSATYVRMRAAFGRAFPFPSKLRVREEEASYLLIRRTDPTHTYSHTHNTRTVTYYYILPKLKRE